MSELYRGYMIVSHHCDSDQNGETLHYHYGTADAAGRVVVPMNCQGPATAIERATYGPNAGGVPTVEEARAEIDRDITLMGS